MLQSFLVYGFLIFFMMMSTNIASKRLVYNKQGELLFWQFEIIFAIAIFALITGLRYDVGVDHLNYLELYQNILKNGSLDTIDLEIGLKNIMHFFTQINAHPSWFFGFVSLLHIMFIFYPFNKERDLLPFLSFVIITGGIYFTLANEIRQSIVVCMFVYAVKLAYEKKTIKYFIFVFLGFLIHKSAIILIPIYFILRIDKDLFKNVFFQFSLLIFFIYLGNTNVWNSWLLDIEKIMKLTGYERYGDISERMSIWERNYTKGLRYFSRLIINTIIILYSIKLKRFFSSTRIKQYYNLYFIGVLSSVTFYNNVIMQRPFRYFDIMQIVISSYLLNYLWKNKNKNRYNILVFLAVIILHIAILYAYVKSDHHTMYYFFGE